MLSSTTLRMNMVLREIELHDAQLKIIRERIAALKAEHKTLAKQHEEEQLKTAKVTKVSIRSRKTPCKAVDPSSTIAKQFCALTKTQQAELLAQLENEEN